MDSTNTDKTLSELDFEPEQIDPKWIGKTYGDFFISKDWVKSMGPNFYFPEEYLIDKQNVNQHFHVILSNSLTKFKATDANVYSAIINGCSKFIFSRKNSKGLDLMKYIDFNIFLSLAQYDEVEKYLFKKIEPFLLYLGKKESLDVPSSQKSPI